MLGTIQGRSGPRPFRPALTDISAGDYPPGVTPAPPERAPAELHEIHSHALESLRFIRRTMENTGSFTAVSGAGQILIGVTALVAAGIAGLQRSEAAWLAVWLIEAAVAALIGSTAIVRKARATGVSLVSGASRKFLICFAPPLAAGALLTPVVFARGAAASLPGVWLLLFGVAVVTGGALSVKIVPFMGVAFMVLGALSLYAPAPWNDLYVAGDALMALGFGGLLIGFGIVIARRYGG
jgi:hypothetical protein